MINIIVAGIIFGLAGLQHLVTFIVAGILFLFILVQRISTGDFTEGSAFRKKWCIVFCIGIAIAMLFWAPLLLKYQGNTLNDWQIYTSESVMPTEEAVRALFTDFVFGAGIWTTATIIFLIALVAFVVYGVKNKETKIFVLGQDNKAAEKPKAADTAEEKTIITVAANKQNAVKGGAEVGYPIALTNAGASSKTYTVRADGAAWANLKVSPSNVLVIDAGDSKAFTVFASAKENAPIGDQTFTVTISSGDKVLKQLPLSMSVSEGQATGVSKLKRGLQVGLVILVILLVIIGLIIGFSKLRGEEEEEEKGGEKTYY